MTGGGGGGEKKIPKMIRVWGGKENLKKEVGVKKSFKDEE